MSFGRQYTPPTRDEVIAARQAPRELPTVKPLRAGVYGGGTKALPEPHVAKREPVNATAAERAHMGRVKRLRCVLCTALGQTQSSITDVHHIREGQGGAQRASHWLTVALCHDGCHQGPHGIHGDRALLRQAKCTELDLLALTLQALDAQKAPT